MVTEKSVSLKLSADVRRSGEPANHVSVSVEGQGDVAERVALAVADAFQQYLRAETQLLQSSAVQPAAVLPASPSQEAAAPVLPAEAVMWTRDEVEQTAPPPIAPAQAGTAARLSAQSAPRPQPWFQVHRVRITGGVGIVLFALAVLIPLLAPVNMRRELLPVPIALGLVGALSLMSAMLPAPDVARTGAAAAQPAASSAPRMTAKQKTDAARLALLTRPNTARRVLGLAFGTVLFGAGVLAPFVLPNAGPDERFMMTLGFAPVALIGAFLAWVFWRRAPTSRLSALGGAEAALHLRRSGLQGAMPAIIVGLVFVLIGVLAVVLFATFLPLLR